MRNIYLVGTLIMIIGLVVVSRIVYYNEEEDGEITVNELYERVLQETKYKEAGLISRSFGGWWSVAVLKEGNCWQLSDYFERMLIKHGVAKDRIKHVKLYKDGKYVHCMLMVDDIVYELSEVNREVVWYEKDSLLELRSEFDYYILK